MHYKPVNIGLILLPSIRSIAYLRMFELLGLYPKEVILMKGDVTITNELILEDQKYGYSKMFFRLMEPEGGKEFDITMFLRRCNALITTVSASNINDDSVVRAISEFSSEYFIFTGGGLVKSQIFDSDKKLIHIHPGIVPEYRGSTCFYYSLLENNILGSTAIIMDKHIDTGDVILSNKFRINYTLNRDQPLFMDYILDPYIRSYTLKKVLAKYTREKMIITQPQTPSNKPAYYIIHPYLRHLTIEKLNSSYNPAEPTGIFEIKNNPK